MLDNDEALECALDLCDILLTRGWRLVTVSAFTDWFAERWPCPDSPSMVYVMNDTLANRLDRDGRVILGNGRLIHAETTYFQITDHENRIAPEMVIAYGLRTPNLLRGGYTFADPNVVLVGRNHGERAQQKETWDGHYASTTGNALFWSPSPPLSDIHGQPYFPPYKDPDCRNRTFTVYVGADWEPYQFAPGNFFGVLRNEEVIRWSKEMAQPIPDSDIRVRYHHTLDGPRHLVTVEVLGDDAVDQPVRLRLAPYFHQGWDHGPAEQPEDPRIPQRDRTGQERHVFGRVGDMEFAYSDANAEVRRESHPLSDGQMHLFNRNPGTSRLYDDNPAFNRGMTVHIDQPQTATVTWIDYPGPNQHVTAEIEFGPHRKGQTYSFFFEYWSGDCP